VCSSGQQKMMKPYKTLLKHPLKERNFLRLLLITGNLGSTYVENLNMLNNKKKISKVTIFFNLKKNANHRAFFLAFSLIFYVL
jgi:hypothetical protein